MDRLIVTEKKTVQGMNLIELIFVMAIIGLLVVIMYPLYADHLRETRRSDAWISLSNAAAMQQRWHSVNFSYTDDIDNIGGDESPEGLYTLSVDADQDSFTVTATAVNNGAQANDTGCTLITLNEQGIQSPENCWP